MEHVELDVNGFTFRAVVCGPPGGRAVLFLHGFPQTSFSWHAQLEAVGAAGYRALAFDQRGYSPGARPQGVADYRIAELVGDVLGVADHNGMDRFDLVGHDWGAMVAWMVARHHPSRVRTLTAVSVPHPAALAAAYAGGDGGDQRQRSSYITVFRAEGGVAEKALLGPDGTGDGLRAMFAASGLDPGREDASRFVQAMVEPGALTAALNWYRATDPQEMAGVGAVTVPTLYVWSTEDIALGRAAAEATARWVEAPYRFEILQGVSHWVPETAPDDLSRLLLEHLGTEYGT